MYSGSRHCFVCGNKNCPGHAVQKEPTGKVKTRTILADKPRKIESRDEYEAFLAEIAAMEIECTRMLLRHKIGPLEHWQMRNQLEELVRRKDVARRIAMAERAQYNKAKGTASKCTIADLKAAEARK